jgi:hypothetical protein
MLQKKNKQPVFQLHHDMNCIKGAINCKTKQTKWKHIGQTSDGSGKQITFIDAYFLSYSYGRSTN